MTAAERSELAEFRQEMNARFDHVDAKIGEIESRVRTTESYISNQKGRQDARKESSTHTIAVLGVIAAFLVLAVAIPAAAIALIHLAALL